MKYKLYAVYVRIDNQWHYRQAFVEKQHAEICASRACYKPAQTLVLGTNLDANKIPPILY